ncbi:matrix metalloproteinase-17 isoform X2 [Passer domesticus]|uniref:matrix metalloproteinase-17 isoform X2 n=1 Tax=Passer domesticus TaxID=48849 RepID=UPI0030FE672A
MLSPAARHRARLREMLLVLALWLVWQEAPAAPTPAAEDITRGVDWLTKFGYLPPPDPVTGQLQTQEELTKAITAMQRFGGLEATGVLDEATLELMKTPRCSLPDLTIEETRRKRFAQAVTKWSKRNLSWRVRTFPKESHLGHDTVRALMYYALKVWSDITPLNFHEVAGNNADIQIDFSKADHNDGYPFDGPGGTVAHAFFPGDHHTAGDTHFDDDEYWTFRSSDTHGMDLFAVAVHEFGHAIGLTHISAIESIMRPYYQGPVGDPLKYDLPYEDKVRIWQLYGVRESVSPTAKPEVSKTDDHPILPELPENRSTVPLRRDVPNRCNTHFDAVAQIRGEAFFFKGMSSSILASGYHSVSLGSQARTAKVLQRIWCCLCSEAQYGDCSTTLFVQMPAPKRHSDEGKLKDINWCQDKQLSVPQRGKIDEVKRNTLQCLFLDIFIAGQKADVKSTGSVDASCTSAASTLLAAPIVAP